MYVCFYSLNLELWHTLQRKGISPIEMLEFLTTKYFKGYDLPHEDYLNSKLIW